MPPKKKVKEGDVSDQMKDLARESRQNPTEAEASLWELLSGKQLGVTFWRQHCFKINGRDYRVDFYCEEAGLVVEIDGPIHQFNKKHDSIREWHITQLGIRILRFSNEEIFESPKQVVREIRKAIKGT